MRYNFLVLFLLLSSCIYAQGVETRDDRGDKESFKKIRNKTLRRELATFTVTGGEENNEKLMLKEVPLTQSGDDYATFNDDSVKVTIRTGSFEAPRHKLLFYDSELVKIDNRPYWGTGGEVPIRGIFSVQVIIGQKTIDVPYSAMNDLFNPNLCWTDAKSKGTSCRTGVYVSNDRKRVYVTMMNSDGAGRYEVTWIIENEKFLKRVLDYGF